MEIGKRETGRKVERERESIVGDQTAEKEDNNKEQTKTDGNVRENCSVWRQVR